MSLVVEGLSHAAPEVEGFATCSPQKSLPTIRTVVQSSSAAALSQLDDPKHDPKLTGLVFNAESPFGPVGYSASCSPIGSPRAPGSPLSSYSGTMAALNHQASRAGKPTGLQLAAHLQETPARYNSDPGAACRLLDDAKGAGALGVGWHGANGGKPGKSGEPHLPTPTRHAGVVLNASSIVNPSKLRNSVLWHKQEQAEVRCSGSGVLAPSAALLGMRPELPGSHPASKADSVSSTNSAPPAGAGLRRPHGSAGGASDAGGGDLDALASAGFSLADMPDYAPVPSRPWSQGHVSSPNSPVASSTWSQGSNTTPELPAPFPGAAGAAPGRGSGGAPGAPAALHRLAHTSTSLHSSLHGLALEGGGHAPPEKDANLPQADAPKLLDDPRALLAPPHDDPPAAAAEHIIHELVNSIQQASTPGDGPRSAPPPPAAAASPPPPPPPPPPPVPVPVPVPGPGPSYGMADGPQAEALGAAAASPALLAPGGGLAGKGSAAPMPVVPPALSAASMLVLGTLPGCPYPVLMPAAAAAAPAMHGVPMGMPAGEASAVPWMAGCDARGPGMLRFPQLQSSFPGVPGSPMLQGGSWEQGSGSWPDSWMGWYEACGYAAMPAPPGQPPAPEATARAQGEDWAGPPGWRPAEAWKALHKRHSATGAGAEAMPGGSAAARTHLDASTMWRDGKRGAREPDAPFSWAAPGRSSGGLEATGPRPSAGAAPEHGCGGDYCWPPRVAGHAGVAEHAQSGHKKLGKGGGHADSGGFGAHGGGRGPRSSAMSVEAAADEECAAAAGDPDAGARDGSGMDPLLARFKHSKFSGVTSMASILGHVVPFSLDQAGSRFIQQTLQDAPPEVFAKAFEEVLPQCTLLSKDVFGNFVVQKFLYHGDEQQRSLLVSRGMVGLVCQLSLHLYGCRVVQKALEVMDLETRCQMAEELRDEVLNCVRDQNGNHVLQKCIELIPTERILYIIDAMVQPSSSIVNLCMNSYGCRVVQRVLEYCTDSERHALVMGQILDNVSTISKDPYGNYVIQHILEKGQPQHRSRIVGAVVGNMLEMTRHKFASNVVEKCLVSGDLRDRQLIISTVLGAAERSTTEPKQAAELPENGAAERPPPDSAGDCSSMLTAMMKDQYGNYVVQRMLEVCEPQQRQQLLAQLQLHSHALKKLAFGKHIMSRIDKLLQTSAQSGGRGWPRMPAGKGMAGGHVYSGQQPVPVLQSAAAGARLQAGRLSNSCADGPGHL